MDYSAIISLVVEVLKTALPIGIIFILTERLIQLFLSLAFPKVFKQEVLWIIVL